jgi:uncharacterized membrane protein
MIKNPLVNNLIVDLLQPLNPFSSQAENISKRRAAIKSFKAKADAKRTATEKFADWLTAKLGSIPFLLLNLAWFSAWIWVNTGHSHIKVFDPYPFNFLTMTVSLEAIFLAIIVLVSQNREGRVNELREEIELQVITTAETEVTKLISLVVKLLEKEGVKMNDPEIEQMLKPINSAQLEKRLEKELGEK